MFGVYFYCRENGLNFLPSTTDLPWSFFKSPLVFAFFLHGFVWIWLIKYADDYTVLFISVTFD